MEPLGVSQILAYLEKLSIRYKINLLTYEKINDLNNYEKVKALEKKIKKMGIFWKGLRVKCQQKLRGKWVCERNFQPHPFH